MTQRERETPLSNVSLKIHPSMRKMNKDEMKAALSTAGVSFNANLGEAKLALLCEQNGINVNVDDSANNAADAASDNDTPEKIVCNGVELTPVGGNDPTIATFVSRRRQREFPQLLNVVPDGNYNTTGRYALYTWQNGEDTPPVFLVVEITNGTDSYFVGEWEFTARTFGIRLQDGSEFTPDWVLNTLATGSARSEVVRNMPANTACRKRSGIGRWTSKSGERNYALSWIERPAE